MSKFLNKKAFIISLVGLPLLILAGLAVYFFNQKQMEITPSAEEKKQETLVEKQLKELEELRNEAGLQPLTEEQKQAQLKDLEALRKKAGVRSLTKIQIQKPAQDGRGSLNEIERQLEELDKLRLAR